MPSRGRGFSFLPNIFRHKGYQRVPTHDQDSITGTPYPPLVSSTRPWDPRPLYHRLDKERKEIRVLRLSPFRARRGLHCTLMVASLRDADVVPYAALSYACGDEKKTASIAVDQHMITIPENLHTALLHLQLENDYRILWCDSICINQKDIQEKGHQIRQMKSIYQQAISTIVWLGPALGTAPYANDLVFDTLEYFGGRSGPFEPSSLPEVVKNGLLEISTFKEFLQRAWWSRLWVLQEVVLAKEVTLQCGDRVINLETLTAASACFSEAWHNGLWAVYRETGDIHAHMDFASALKQAIDFISDLRRLGLRNDASVYDFIELLSKCRESNTTDPRDKIFGLLGMAPGWISDLVNPSYEDHVRDIYTETALRCSYMAKSTILFSQAGLRGRDARDTSFPSWAPDWRMQGGRWVNIELRLRQEKLFDASGKLLYCWTEPRYGMKMLGKVIDTVIKVSDKMPSQCKDPGALACFAKWEGLVAYNDNNSSRSGERGESTKSNPYWRVVLNGAVPSDRQELRLLSTDDEQEFLKWQGLLYSRSNTPHIWDDYITSTTRNRRLFICASGLVGLGPAETMPMDAVHILAGSTQPCLLRQTKIGEGDGHRLVGECFVDGIMQARTAKKPTVASGRSDRDRSRPRVYLSTSGSVFRMIHRLPKDNSGEAQALPQRRSSITSLHSISSEDVPDDLRWPQIPVKRAGYLDRSSRSEFNTNVSRVISPSGHFSVRRSRPIRASRDTRGSRFDRIIDTALADIRGDEADWQFVTLY